MAGIVYVRFLQFKKDIALNCATRAFLRDSTLRMIPSA
jgi:hypothetical protein